MKTIILKRFYVKFYIEKTSELLQMEKQILWIFQVQKIPFWNMRKIKKHIYIRSYLSLEI